MSRRGSRLIATNTYTVKLTDLLNDNVIHDSNCPIVMDKYRLVIEDDRRVYQNGDLNKIIAIIKTNFPRREKIVFQDMFVDSYEELLNIISLNKLTNVSIINLKDRAGNKLYGYDKEKRDLPVFATIDKDELSKVPLKYYSKINSVNNDIHCYDRNIMSDEDFTFGIKFIGDQIKKYAENDVQKVLLLDKMLRENVKYDKNYYYELRHNMSEMEQGKHKSHKVQTVLRDRCAVCNAISYFAFYILSYLDIKCKEVSSDSFGGHAWNEIELYKKWFSNDFTHSLWFDRENGTKYTLVKRPSDNHYKDNNETFDNFYTFRRDLLIKEMDKIKNIHIEMPLYDYMDFTSYNETTKYENRESVRRGETIIGLKRTPSKEAAKSHNDSVIASINLTRRSNKELRALFGNNDEDNIVIGKRRRFTDSDFPIIGKRRDN